MSDEAKSLSEHPLVFKDEFATREDACIHAMHQRAYEEVIPHLKGARVLDFGCNNGYGSALLAAHAAHVVGLDISVSAITDARRRFNLPTLEFVSYPGDSIPYSDDSFDVVVSFQVIEHVLNIPLYLAEIRRVLKNDGVAFISTPNRLIRLDDGMVPWNEYHIREFRPTELERALKAQFSEVAIKGLSASPSIYRIEYSRCQRIRAASRGRRSLSERLMSGVISRLAKFQGLILNLMGGIRIPTEKFYYSADDLDVALDLFAVCRKH